MESYDAESAKADVALGLRKARVVQCIDCSLMHMHSWTISYWSGDVGRSNGCKLMILGRGAQQCPYFQRTVVGYFASSKGYRLQIDVDVRTVMSRGHVQYM